MHLMKVYGHNRTSFITKAQDPFTIDRTLTNGYIPVTWKGVKNVSNKLRRLQLTNELTLVQSHMPANFFKLGHRSHISSMISSFASNHSRRNIIDEPNFCSFNDVFN